MKALQLSKIEGLTIILGLLLSAGATALLMSNLPLAEILFGIRWRGGVGPIGQVDSLEGNLRRKGRASPGFFELASKSQVHNHDTVVTGDNSLAKIVLKDGSEIQLSANSMVRLVIRPGFTLDGISRSATIKVIRGSVTGKSKTTPLLLETPERKITIPSTSTETVKAEAPKALPKKAPSLKVVTQKELDYLALLERESTTAPAAEPVASQSAPAPLKSSDIQVISLKDRQVFSVDPLSKNLDYPLDIRFQSRLPKQVFVGKLTHQDTSTAVLKEALSTQGGYTTMKALLSRPGQYLLEIIDPQTNRVLSKKSLRLNSKVPGIEVLPPLIGGKVVQSNEFQGDHFKSMDITLRWKPGIHLRDKQISDYKLTFHKRADQKGKALFTQNTPNENLLISKEKKFPGTFFYSVEAKNSRGFIIHSGPVEFRFDFLPPVLALPKNRSIIGKNELARLKGKILMTWRKTNFTESYQLEISNNPKFSPSVVKTSTKENFFLWKKPPQGKFYWRVRSRAKGRRSAPSLTGEFSIQ